METYIARSIILYELGIDVDENIKVVWDYLENIELEISIVDDIYDTYMSKIVNKTNEELLFTVNKYKYIEYTLYIMNDFYNNFNVNRVLIYHIVEYFLKKRLGNLEHIRENVI